MTLGFIGLGRMGHGLSNRAQEHGHETHGFAPSQESRDAAAEEGIITHESVEKMLEAMPEQKIVWVMVPAGKITHQVITDLCEQLSEGDIVIDGGNSFFKDSVKHYEMLKERGIQFLDCGTSGGLMGEEIGYSMMIGGDKETFDTVRPIFEALAAPEAFEYMGPAGAGHYVKMVHNGTEYGIMEAMAEGFELIKSGPYQLDMVEVSKVWKNASIIRSYLMDLAHEAFKKDPNLEAHTDRVDDNGMGRWTVDTAIEHGIPAPAITDAVYARFRSQQDSSFAGKSLAALRNEFGGHKVHKKD